MFNLFTLFPYTGCQILLQGCIGVNKMCLGHSCQSRTYHSKFCIGYMYKYFWKKIRVVCVFLFVGWKGVDTNLKTNSKISVIFRRSVRKVLLHRRATHSNFIYKKKSTKRYEEENLIFIFYRISRNHPELRGIQHNPPLVSGQNLIFGIVAVGKFYASGTCFLKN